MRVLTVVAALAALVMPHAVTAQEVSGTEAPGLAVGKHILVLAPLPKEEVTEAKYAGCKVFMRPDGRVFRSLLKRTVRADGTCPESFVDGKLISDDQIEIAAYGDSPYTSHRVCYLSATGSCIALRVLGHPK